MAVNHSSDAASSTLVSVNVGMPADVAWRGKTVYTGIYKNPVTGPVMVRRLNIDGDGQGDLAGHGGEQRAVMVYQTESYDYWSRFLGRDDLQPGHFGENFTITGLGDDEVCIGDRYVIGGAEFEVTQPRVTCFRVGMRLGEPEIPNLLVAHHRPGFYFRVITEGRVQAGDAIVRTRRGQARTQRRRYRRAALSARSGRGPAPQGRRRACSESRLAAVVHRIAGRTRKLHRRNGTADRGRTGVERISPTARGRYSPRKRCNHVDSVRGRRPHDAADPATGPVSDPARS